VYINNIYEASGMNSSIHVSTYENLRVKNSLIMQNLQEWFYQHHIHMRIDPEGPSLISIHQKFREYLSEFYV